jgi:hypothetical protein
VPKKDAAGLPGESPRSPLMPRKSWGSAVIAALFVRRKRWTLTWVGRLLTLTVSVMLAVVLARGLCGFLAITSPVGGEFLVVEGWMPGYAYREAATVFRKGGYRKIIAAGAIKEDGDADGGPPERFGEGLLMGSGVPSDLIVMASSKEAIRDRTFHSAMAVKLWLREQGVRTTSIDVVTVGAHARRSRLLYQKALGDEVTVGVISVEDREFDPNHWWRSSEGVRTVVDESIAYLYARLFFSISQ